MTDDGGNTLDVLRSEISEFARERDWKRFHNPKDLTMALSVEASELLDLYLWDRVPDRERVKEEIADVMIYLLELSDVTGIDLGRAVRDKMESNRKKYPPEKARGRSEKYDQL